MREVCVLGVGLHKFGRFPEKSVEDMGRVAILNALDDAGIEFRDIEAAYCGRVYAGLMGAGLRVINEVGQTGIPIVNVEQACSSSSVALRLGYYAIGAGICDMALIVGFEKMERGMLRATSPANSYDELVGMSTPMAWYALEIRRHMEQYGTTAKQIAMVSVKSHRNGTLNPYAQYQQEMTLEQVLNSRMIADPITLYECSPTTDGASAAIICSREKAQKYTNSPIFIAGWAAGSPIYEKGKDYDELGIRLTEKLAKEAYERAGMGPGNMDVVQIHDAAASGEIQRFEALGFCNKGEGGRWVEEGRTEIGGEIPVNTDGGLLSRGHPVGATGLAQIAEVVWQLRGQAGKRQVAGKPKAGLCHNSGIGGVNITILKT
jgi:acetyl-CoA acetyltransferase